MFGAFLARCSDDGTSAWYSSFSNVRHHVDTVAGDPMAKRTEAAGSCEGLTLELWLKAGFIPGSSTATAFLLIGDGHSLAVRHVGAIE